MSHRGRRWAATGSNGSSPWSRSSPQRRDVVGTKIALSSVNPLGTNRTRGSPKSTMDRWSSAVESTKKSLQQIGLGLYEFRDGNSVQAEKLVDAQWVTPVADDRVVARHQDSARRLAELRAHLS